MERVENAKVINATPCSYNGIDFKSKLEMNIYKAIESEGYAPLYEPITFTIWNGFKPRIPFYKKNKSSRKMALENTKIRDITYTPDFIFDYCNHKIIIEAKGFCNDVFPIKKKLFRKWLEEHPECLYFEVYSKKNILQTIDIIKQLN